MKDDCGPYCPLDCAPLCTKTCCNVTMSELGLNSDNCEKLCPNDKNILDKMSKVQAESFECSDYCNQINYNCCNLLKTSKILSYENIPTFSILKTKEKQQKNILELDLKSCIKFLIKYYNSNQQKCPFECSSACYPSCTNDCCTLNLDTITPKFSIHNTNKKNYMDSISKIIEHKVELYPIKGNCGNNCSKSCFPQCSPACCSK